ncbi:MULTISPECIES: pyridoxamine 5'-phosphate oxidase family protein [unclassified Corynebacterium]|uniref:pyridoxamine 5'-phosphate oxidase family protein n=1 Tax=unclassified Corynebacterium TaxID=2624378 RepID=UPI0029C9C532|nr:MULTISPECIES: pyridoxamine 5'-phosphate oxidase family protein [unclassified Corynebacterium]WPF65733.1 pyridoxamine 5'-phosphate oxidase family protein [Corynebacterium sp. 22KM0430]WPF68228.1 pyridoxamine 5'-phosphate oxidase family protein [Corynebacterium sp. 21KM1197]
MTSHDDSGVRTLSAEECLEKLRSLTLGRLVVRRSEEMDIFPVNYVVDGHGEIYFRTAEGTKFFSLSLNPEVLFEADEVAEGQAWSVVVRGSASVLGTAEEMEYADSLPLHPWVPTLKYNYVRVTVGEISGRAFALGEEPERY